MIIRPMHPDDIPRVIAIADTLAGAPRWNRDAYMRALDPSAAPVRIALVAEDAGAGVVGFLVAALIPPQAELESIAVPKPAQRQRVASRLVEKLIVDLKERQILEVMLEVRESNLAALSLYRALGFVQTGRRSRYYSEPEEDAILMQRPIG